MKSHQFKLSSFTRLQISKWLSIAVVLSFFLPAVTLAKTARYVSRAKTRNSINATAPLTTVIEVNTTGDGDNLDPSVGCDTEPGISGEQCSLRAAIQRANVLNGDGEIRVNIPSTEFNCSSSLCIINLTRTLPTLETSMRIIGPGANKLWVRRTTAAEYRIFTVTANEVTLSGLTISGGKPAGVLSGGALVNSGFGNVNIIDCVLSNNAGGFGGAVSHEGPGIINITNSVFEANKAIQSGAAIYNGTSGTINVTGSVIYENTVTEPFTAGFNGGGAGINNAGNGAVNVTGSFILNNIVNVPGLVGVSGGGAGISNSANGTVNVTTTVLSGNIVTGGDGPTSILRGGGIRNDASGTVTVSNSLLFKNKAINGGGIANASGTLKVSNSTITENTAFGGGLYGQGTVKSSIIAKNILGASAEIDVSGTFTSEGFNFLGTQEGSTGFTAPTDLKGTVGAPLDPKFDPNGVTITVLGFPHPVSGLPLCGSPVIDKGMNGGQTTDIRGMNFLRTVDDLNQANPGDGTDIGAFERETACAQTMLTVNSTADSDDVSPGDGNCDSDAATTGSQCSLRAALREANSIAGDYVINFSIPTNDPGFDQSTGRHTINLMSVLPDVTQGNVAINGPGSGKLTVRRNTGGFYRLLSFNGVVETVSISGMTFNNGLSTADGGAVSFNGKTLNVTDCVFSDNTTGNSGGGIFAFATKVNVTDSKFTGNFAGSTIIRAGGGAIHVRGALSVTNSTFSDNLTNS